MALMHTNKYSGEPWKITTTTSSLFKCTFTSTQNVYRFLRRLNVYLNHRTSYNNLKKSQSGRPKQYTGYCTLPPLVVAVLSVCHTLSIQTTNHMSYSILCPCTWKHFDQGCVCMDDTSLFQSFLNDACTRTSLNHSKCSEQLKQLIAEQFRSANTETQICFEMNE